MKKFILKWLTNFAGIILVAQTIPGIVVIDLSSALVAALMIGLLNTFIKPIVLIITLPINILSLGLFTLFINTFVFYAASKLVSGFSIAGFWSAFWGALMLSVISFLMNLFTGSFGKFEMNVKRGASGQAPGRGKVIDAEVVQDKDNKKDEEKKRLS